MKLFKICSVLPVLFLASNVFAETKSPYIDVNLYNNCEIEGNSCVIEDLGLRIDCSGSITHDSTIGLYCNDGDFSINATKYPLVGISSYYYPLTIVDGKYQTNSNRSSVAKTFSYTFPFTDHVDYVYKQNTPYLHSVKLQRSIHNSVFTVASSLNALLNDSYRFIHLELEKFKQNIKKSDIGHTRRLQLALEEGMLLLTATDEESGELLYSALDWRIQENSRLIIAFGSIMDELLAEYDHVNTIKNSIINMRSLVAQLRKSYGWDRNGLSGTVSKASSTLLEVIRLEVRELGSIRMSLGESTKAFSNLLKVTGELKAKIDAASSGDMRAQREMWIFLDEWNKEEWQAELTKLVNAGPDVKGIVSPKLTMLIQAMESIEELSDAGFLIPELD